MRRWEPKKEDLILRAFFLSGEPFFLSSFPARTLQPRILSGAHPLGEM